MKRLFSQLITALRPERSASRREGAKGLIAHFPLTETSGTAVGDVVTERGGMLFNSSMGQPMWSNPGLRFSGRGFEYVLTPPPAGARSDRFSVAAWIRPACRSQGVIVGAESGRLATPYLVYLSDEGQLTLSNTYFDPSIAGPITQSWSSRSVVPRGEWSHIAITYDGSKVRFFIDGTLDPNQPEAIAVFDSVTGQFIGGRPGNASFEGTICDVRVYSRELSGNEISGMDSVCEPMEATALDGSAGGRRPLKDGTSATTRSQAIGGLTTKRRPSWRFFRASRPATVGNHHHPQQRVGRNGEPVLISPVP